MHGHVTLLSWTPDMEAMIASGGRISTMDGTADEIRAKSLAAGKEKNEKLIGKVLSSGHTSVLEHGYVNLAFENVSVLAEQFLIEFRLASFTVKSRRYVDFSGAGYVAPELPSPQAQALFDETVRELFRIYDELEAAGVPKEDARFVLPYCFCSNFFCSMNARELVHVMNELRYGRGKEIRELQELGESLFSQCEEKLPFLAVRKPGAYEKAPLPLRTGKLLEPEAQVTLLDGTQEPERLICRAAYLARGQQMPELTQREQTELLRALLQGNRKRELEQASFTLLYGGMSLAALTHLTRHRMQSLAAPDLLANARYDRYVLPESVREAVLRGIFTGRRGGREARFHECRNGRAVLSSGQRAPGAGRLDNERGRAIHLRPPAHVSEGTVGNPGAGDRGAARSAAGAPDAFFALRSDMLCLRHLPGGQNVLREDGAGPRSVCRKAVIGTSCGAVCAALRGVSS